MTKAYQVVGIGNALVDVISHVEDGFLTANGVEKGIMQLIDTARAVELYGRMGPAREISGGSAANTVAGIAALGGRTAYVGKVKDDQLGAIFAHDLRAQGADYATPLAPTDHPAETGRCMVLVTPDGERSMNTYLGVSEFLAPADIDEAQMAAAEWIFLEGYRFDGPELDRRLRQGRARRQARRRQGRDHPLRSLLRRAPPRRVPAHDPRRRRPAGRQRARAAVALPDRRPRGGDGPRRGRGPDDRLHRRRRGARTSSAAASASTPRRPR